MTVTISFKMPAAEAEKLPKNNRSQFIRNTLLNRLREISESAGGKTYQPKSKLLKEAASIRKSYRKQHPDEPYLDRESVSKELAERRGR